MSWSYYSIVSTKEEAYGAFSKAHIILCETKRLEHHKQITGFRCEVASWV